MKITLLLLMTFFFYGCAISEEHVLSENAPKDKPVAVYENKVKEFYEAQEPYIKQARETYPHAKEKYIKGLPKGENFFITTRLIDFTGKVEQVFVLVKSINEGVISGDIYSHIHLVKGYSYGQRYSFPESEVYDWLITKPDGREEGNFVGKFIDAYNKH